MDLLTGDDTQLSAASEDISQKSNTPEGRHVVGARRRAPPPPPPSTSGRENEHSFVPVDGLTPKEVHDLFNAADADRDGRVADEEARVFFLGTGLDPHQLSKIWNAVKSLESKRGVRGLSHRQFSQALRLVALVQSGVELNEDLASIAVNPAEWKAQGRSPLPPPRLDLSLFSGDLQPTYASSGSRQDRETVLETGLEFLGIEETIHSPGETPEGIGERESMSSNPAAAEAARASNPMENETTTALQQSAATSIDEHARKDTDEGILSWHSAMSSYDGCEISVPSADIPDTIGDYTPPLAYELRYPPLHLDNAAKLTFLVGSNGCLFAGPSFNHGLLQWANVENDACQPMEKHFFRHADRRKMMLRLSADLRATHSMEEGDPNEDPDAAPSKEIDMSPQGKSLTCVHIDQCRGIAWVGDKEGWVAAYDVSGEPGVVIQTTKAHLATWQAHRVGSVTCICVAPNGELWTGSSRGSIRIWRLQAKGRKRIDLGSIAHGNRTTKKYESFYCKDNMEDIPSEPATHGVLVPSRPRELRRANGERPHNVPVRAIVATLDGQLMWTASSRTIVLWDNITGAYLGRLHRENGVPVGLPSEPRRPEAVDAAEPSTPIRGLDPYESSSEEGASFFMHPATSIVDPPPDNDFRINAGKGLDIDAVTGKILVRPSPADVQQYVSQQESWASLSDRGVAEFAERISESAGRAARFVSKLGMKLAGLGNTNETDPSTSVHGDRYGSSKSTSNLRSRSAVQHRSYLDNASDAVADASMRSKSDLSGRSVDTSSLMGYHVDASGTPDSTTASMSNPFLGGTVPSAAASGGGGLASEVIGIVSSVVENIIWVAFRQGVVERYTSSGRLLSVRHFGGNIQTMSPVGPRLWIGFTNGVITILDADGGALKTFVAHRSGIMSIAEVGSRTFTLAVDGSIHGWSSTVPSKEDTPAVHRWRTNVEQKSYARRSFHVLAVTWNCGQCRPEPQSAYFRWIKEHGFDKSLVVVGYQEVETGGGSVALAAAKDAFNSKLAEKGNSNAQFWSSTVLEALGGSRHWHQIALRQLSGMLVIAFARNNLRGHIGEIATASVACGVLGVGGNKGAVALEFSLYRRKVAVICSHFAAHQNAIEARNANYDTIVKQLHFQRRVRFPDLEEVFNVESLPPPLALLHSASYYYFFDPMRRSKSVTQKHPRLEGRGRGRVFGGRRPPAPLRNGKRSFVPRHEVMESVKAGSDDALSSDSEDEVDVSLPSEVVASGDDDQGGKGFVHVSTSTPSLSSSHGDDVAVVPRDAPAIPIVLEGENLHEGVAVVWMGDFNYRIDGRYDQVKELAVAGDLLPLLACDQLRREMVAGRVFRGMKEGEITFPPTYKFDKGVESTVAYDTSDKRRTPAWCDRILYRGSTPHCVDDSEGDSSGKEEDNDRYSRSIHSSFVSENHSRQMSMRTAESMTENVDTKTATEKKSEGVELSLIEYGSWGDVYDSDHRPVYASFTMSLPVFNASTKRKLAADILCSCLSKELRPMEPPEVVVFPNVVRLTDRNAPKQGFAVRNPGDMALQFVVVPAFSTDVIAQFPLELRPMKGWIPPGKHAEIFIKGLFRGEKPLCGLLGGSGGRRRSSLELQYKVIARRAYGAGGNEDEATAEVTLKVSISSDFYN